ncbi:efflux transporter outer membrane subunit, partial [Ralstonia pseudosolanacearum]
MCTSTSLILSAAAAVALGGCAVGPDFKAPVPPAASGYTVQPLPAATASAPPP